MAERHVYTNRLIKEKSPYLLQHSHNPVDWYSWGPEAFEAAKSQDKPIFLSIGYATCHWCHVMEKESFEDAEVAEKMNSTFINIKVDREELPEVDALYMEFAQSMMAGAAGWPLNVILTPDLQPFFAATYLPANANYGLSGLSELIERIKDIWNSEEKVRVTEQAEQIVEIFSRNIMVAGDRMPEKELIDEAADKLFKMADPAYGGIKGAPKFPIGYQWNFLLHYAAMTDDNRALFLAERTLDMMQRGGIYDHLGGGFSRYSTDEQWLVPHFEKMLYDNAILAFTYLEVWQATQRPFYRTVCEEILNYILRDMTHPEGGFYSAEDADSEGHEGYFYTWTEAEIQNILGKAESLLFCEFYGVTANGNFEGRNILHTSKRLEVFAEEKGMESQELGTLFAMQRQILWKTRKRRISPLKDDKILSSWNGLMIFSMAEAGAAFGNEMYLSAALKAATFIKDHLWVDGKLLRRWRDGEGSFRAGLDEYAYMIKGLLSLFETGCGTKWLELALQMTQILSEQYKGEGGAFYQTDGADHHIILRKVHLADGAEPSGNAIHCENLLRLYLITSEKHYLLEAEDILKAVYPLLENHSPGYSFHALNLIRYYDKNAVTCVIALNDQEKYKNELSQLFYHASIPHRAIVWRSPSDDRLQDLIPFLKTYKPVDNKTTLYLCSQGTCQKPITELSEMITAIHNI